MVDEKQRKKWFLERKCHACGKDTPHDHPNHVWLSNPVPEIPEDELTDERKKRLAIEREMNDITLGAIIGK